MQSEPSVLRLSLESAVGEVDRDLENHYRSIQTYVTVAGVSDLRKVQPLVNYLVGHERVDDYAQIYLAAHWENAVRRVNRLGQLTLVDTFIPNVTSLDVKALTE